MQIIGLSGYARSGKDEAAKVLVEEFGFKRVAFADKLREVVYQLNPLVAVKPYYNEGTLPPNGMSRVFLQEVIDVYGWDGYKSTEYGTEIRRLLQRMGTEAGRQTLYDSIWVDMALTGHDEDASIVVTDCRFPNEYDAITAQGGKVWRIERAGVGPANAHASETSLDNHEFYFTLSNNGTLEEFRQHVRDAYDAFEESLYLDHMIGA